MPRRVLHVDDDAVSRKLVGFVLSKRGFEVAFDSEGSNVLQLATDLQPDLILLDVSLPGACGIELTKALKSNLFTRRIPLILLSARAMPNELVNGLAAGCDAYLTKPFNTRTLPIVIERLME